MLSIIIVNYNTLLELSHCLDSIYTYLKGIEFEVIVLDNNSPDRRIEKLSYTFPMVKFILSKINLGFSKGNNFAVNEASGDYLLILNPDTIFIEDCVSPIINFISENKNVGSCSPMLVYKDLSFQNSTGGKMGILYEMAEAFMFISIYRKIRNRINKKYTLSRKPFKVAWTSGAFIILKKSIYIEVGGFNEKFFLNYEDHDFCKKIQDKGYYNYHFPYLKCIHLDQTSQKKDYESFVYSRYDSRLTFSHFHYGFFTAIVVKIIHIIGLVERMIFVNFIYNGIEKIQRKKGYKKALYLYLGLTSE